MGFSAVNACAVSMLKSMTSATSEGSISIFLKWEMSFWATDLRFFGFRFETGKYSFPILNFASSISLSSLGLKAKS